jgi:glycosyltransferase involved in cell wall biosynthesis
VCTTSSGISELVERTDPAAVVPADDAQQLADAMGRYLASPSLAAQMGQRGQELVRAELSLSVTSRKMEALYNEIVAKPKEVRTG